MFVFERKHTASSCCTFHLTPGLLGIYLILPMYSYAQQDAQLLICFLTLSTQNDLIMTIQILPPKLCLLNTLEWLFVIWRGLFVYVWQKGCTRHVEKRRGGEGGEEKRRWGERRGGEGRGREGREKPKACGLMQVWCFVSSICNSASIPPIHFGLASSFVQSAFCSNTPSSILWAFPHLIYKRRRKSSTSQYSVCIHLVYLLCWSLPPLREGPGVEEVGACYG